MLPAGRAGRDSACWEKKRNAGSLPGLADLQAGISREMTQVIDLPPVMQWGKGAATGTGGAQ